jgi:hypothetical protein
MSKHTPGPWKVGIGSVRTVDVDENDFYQCVCETPFKTEINHPTWEANARLIAMAPEMLDLLKRMDLRLSDRKKLSTETKHLFFEMKNVIAKAEGRE